MVLPEKSWVVGTTSQLCNQDRQAPTGSENLPDGTGGDGAEYTSGKRQNARTLQVSLILNRCL